MTKDHDEDGLPIEPVKDIPISRVPAGMLVYGVRMADQPGVKRATPMAGLPTEGEDARSVARGVMNERQRHPTPLMDDDLHKRVMATAADHSTDGGLDDPLTYPNEVGPEIISLSAVDQTAHDAAASYLETMGLDPTPDAIEQLTWVFLPCLRIMCERSWDPEGGTWRKAGRLGALADTRKKFERFWERLWKHGKTGSDPSAVDSGHDLINYVGFVMRADQERWGDWGEPG